MIGLEDTRKVTQRSDTDRLLAEVKGDLASLLDVDEEMFGRAGGRERDLI